MSTYVLIPGGGGDPWEWHRLVPELASASRHDRMFPLDFQRRVARERLAIDVEEIDGGHMLALSNPAELADRLVVHHLARDRHAGLQTPRRPLSPR